MVWVQDEPRNQGAWPFMALNLPQALADLGETRLLQVVSRKASASPATGSSKRHAEQQAELIAGGLRAADAPSPSPGRETGEPVSPGAGSAHLPTRARRYAAWLVAAQRDNLASVYFTDRGIEELAARRGEEEVSFEWLADQLRTFVDLNPEFETPVERLATWLARLDDDED